MEIAFATCGDFTRVFRAKRPAAAVAAMQEGCPYAVELAHSEQGSGVQAPDVLDALGAGERLHAGWVRGGWPAAELARAVAQCRAPKVTAAERRRLQADFRSLLRELADDMRESGGGREAELGADARARLAAWRGRAESQHELDWVAMLERELARTLG